MPQMMSIARKGGAAVKDETTRQNSLRAMNRIAHQVDWLLKGGYPRHASPRAAYNLEWRRKNWQSYLEKARVGAAKRRVAWQKVGKCTLCNQRTPLQHNHVCAKCRDKRAQQCRDYRLRRKLGMPIRVYGKLPKAARKH